MILRWSLVPPTATPSLQPARISFRPRTGPARALGSTLSPCLETGIPASRTHSRGLGNVSPDLGECWRGLGRWFRGLGTKSPCAGIIFPHLGTCSPGLGNHSPGLGKRASCFDTVSPGGVRMFLRHDHEFRDMGKWWTGPDTSSPGLGNESPGLGKPWRGLRNQSPGLGKRYLGPGRRFSPGNGFWSFVGRACAGGARSQAQPALLISHHASRSSQPHEFPPRTGSE